MLGLRGWRGRADVVRDLLIGTGNVIHDQVSEVLELLVLLFP